MTTDELAGMLDGVANALDVGHQIYDPVIVDGLLAQLTNPDYAFLARIMNKTPGEMITVVPKIIGVINTLKDVLGTDKSVHLSDTLRDLETRTFLLSMITKFIK